MIPHRCSAVRRGIQTPERRRFQPLEEQFRDLLTDDKMGLPLPEKDSDRRSGTVLGRDGGTMGGSQERSPREAVRQHLLMYFVCFGDLAFVWFYRSLRPADDFFVLRCHLCDLIRFALVLERSFGGQRVPRSWRPHNIRHPHQSFK